MESLQKVQSQVDSLQSLIFKINETAQFGSIDKDSLLSKIRDMYETVLTIDFVLPQIIAVHEEQIPDFVKVEPSVLEQLSDVEFEDELQKVTTFELNDIVQTPHLQSPLEEDLLIRIDDVQPEIQAEPKLQPEPIEQTTTLEQPHVVEQPQTILTETPKEIPVEPQPTVVEIPVIKPTVHAAESLAAKLSHTKIPNIAAGLTFSDRLMFQKQLFKDRSEEFAKTISDLDDLDTFEEAVAWLQATYKWDYENAIVKKFLEIVQRRY